MTCGNHAIWIVSVFCSLWQFKHASDLRVGDDKGPNFPSCVNAFGFFPNQLLLSLLAESFNPLYTVSDVLLNVRDSNPNQELENTHLGCPVECFGVMRQIR